MTTFDMRYRTLHKQFYSKFLDELDIDVAKNIMAYPNGEEAQIFNLKVEAAIKKELEAPVPFFADDN